MEKGGVKKGFSRWKRRGAELGMGRNSGRGSQKRGRNFRISGLAKRTSWLVAGLDLHILPLQAPCALHLFFSFLSYFVCRLQQAFLS
jgi:hypothetical protein